MNNPSQANLAEWNAGFTDSEGSINVNVFSDSRASTDYGMTPHYTLTHSYSAGLFDGDGCISMEVFKAEYYSTGYLQRPKVSLTQVRQENDVVDHLCEFADRLGVEYNVRDVPQQEEGYMPKFEFTIRNRDSVKTYLQALLPHLVVKEEQARIMLEEIIPRMDRGMHTNKRGFLKIMEHADRMNEMKGGKRGKYNLEYFENEWGMTLD